MNRRRFLATLTAFAPAPGMAATTQRRGDTLDVRKFGAFGNGKLPDLRQIREAIRVAAEKPGGATIYFPPGDYFLGAADDAVLLNATRLRNVRFMGERATISCRSVSGSSTMLQLEGCQDVVVEGLTFRDHGLNREVNWLGAAAIRLANLDGTGCRDIEIRHCIFDSVLAGVVCRRTEGNLRIRSRGIKLTDLLVRGSYYGFSFQDNGDDVIGRRLRCQDVKRSYFPFGTTNHDIELDTSDNKTGFTDILIKCYHGDTSQIKAKVRCRGKRGGDAIVALDHQHEQGRGTIRQIDLQLDIDDIDCRLETVLLIRSFDRNAKHERRTGNRWEDISVDGDITICDKTQLIEIASVGQTPGVLRIGSRLAKNPRLPRTYPGFRVIGV